MLCLQSPVTQPGNPNSRGAALRMRVAGQPWQQLSEAPERTVLLSFPSVARELLVVFVFKDLLFVGVCLSMCVCVCSAHGDQKGVPDSPVLELQANCELQMCVQGL